MAKSIEMNYKNSDAYETLYPLTLADNIFLDSDQSQTILDKIDSVSVDETFQVGDIICTCRENLTDNWILCDGRVIGASEYPELASKLANLGLEGVWQEIEVPTMNAMGWYNNKFWGAQFSGNSLTFYEIGEDGIPVQVSQHTLNDNFSGLYAAVNTRHGLVFMIMASGIGVSNVIITTTDFKTIKYQSDYINMHKNDFHYNQSNDCIYITGDTKNDEWTGYVFTWNSGTQNWNKKTGCNYDGRSIDTNSVRVYNNKIYFSKQYGITSEIQCYNFTGNIIQNPFIHSNEAYNYSGITNVNGGTGSFFLGGNVTSKPAIVPLGIEFDASSGTMVATQKTAWNYNVYNQISTTGYNMLSNVENKLHLYQSTEPMTPALFDQITSINISTLGWSSNQVLGWLNFGAKYIVYFKNINKALTIDNPNCALPNLPSVSTSNQKEQYYIKAK